jgi:hypothetical protein
VLNLEDYGNEEGNAADLMVLETETSAEAVVAGPVRKLALKRGHPVARDGRGLFEVD